MNETKASQVCDGRINAGQVFDSYLLALVLAKDAPEVHFLQALGMDLGCGCVGRGPGVVMR